MSEMHPVIYELLRGLGKLGKRALAAGVDTALEEAEIVARNVQTRIQAGRKQAQEMSQRPKEHIDVEARVVDDEES
jgi:hypothetical protein